MTRKLITLFALLLLICNCSPLLVKASTPTTSSTIELLDNGYYYETTIPDYMLAVKINFDSF